MLQYLYKNLISEFSGNDDQSAYMLLNPKCSISSAYAYKMVYLSMFLCWTNMRLNI